ncbi:haloacid dehalogenase (HAD) superfamily protein [Thalictrum thalictroides]|uniref:Haloacid dehalogenase (HAD) superfamily protein n=1 Tax=Thalictrum thalictroides TaxID=46969 RepID=A0A7J6VS70_THATH|nr:haloacid dehalogenase (HAD) superfamily protein [Thalictrum thalictroides]
MYTFIDNNSTNNKKKKNPNQESSEVVVNSEVSEKLVHTEISSNMWWQKLRAVLSQRLNLEGISSAMAVMTREQNLVIPHITVKDIRWVDWVELEKKGFRGVVFDKDNTLTEPYSLSLWPPLESSLDGCKSVFGDNVAVFSNSAGLHQYDADGSKARAIEDSIGIHVLRHGVKKPGGSAEDIEKYFGCSASLLIMVGDRYLTDVVYGNRNGFLTVLTEPLSLDREPFIVKQVRKLEASLANYWFRKGVKPVCHSLLSEAMQCVKIPPPV